VLPVGTANVLANELGLDRRLEQAAAAIGNLQVRRIGVGRLCNGERRPFICMAGIGLDAHIVYRLSLPLKNRVGKVAYWVAGAQVLGRRLAEFEVEVDGRSYASSFTLVSRVRNYGGDFRIAPTATLLDDSFEIVLFDQRNTLGYVKYVAGMVVNRLARMRGITVLRGRSLRFRAPSTPHLYVQVDGEYAGRLPATIEFVPDSLSLLMPAAYAAAGQPGPTA
jgi:diacylglycerol kinase (ATP)